VVHVAHGDWIAAPYPKGHKQKDAADGETKRLAQLTLFAGSLLIAKTKMAINQCFPNFRFAKIQLIY